MTSFFEDDDAQSSVASLIEVCDTGYRVNETTLKWICDFEKPFGVVTCAGKYRTGKSFLLNRFAEAESGKGFGVGETVQACTKGIWVYKKFLPSGRGDDMHILVMDTEGIDSLDADDTHDVRIFTLALLLSSSFMYNSVGTIDEASLQTLSLMTRVTQNVRINSEKECTSTDLSDHMPAFYWILRDFSLKLVHKDGSPMSEDQYLTNALITDSTDSSKGAIREAIRNAFPVRKLVTLPRPANVDDTAIQTLEHKLFNVNSKFGNSLKDLRSRVFREMTPFRVEGHDVSGSMYAELCRYLVDAIQSEAVPVIKDSWTLMASVQCRDLKDVLIKEMTQVTGQMKPKPEATMDAELKVLVNALLKRYDDEAMKPVDLECKEYLKNELRAISESTFQRLARDVEADISTRMNVVHSEVEQDMSKLLMAIKNAQGKFAEECDNDPEFMKMWRIELSKRCIEQWIPLVIRSMKDSESSLSGSVQQYESTILSLKNAHKDELDALRSSTEVDMKQNNSELQLLREQLEAVQKLHTECEINLTASEIRERELTELLTRKKEEGEDDRTSYTSSSYSKESAELTEELEQQMVRFRDLQMRYTNLEREHGEISQERDDIKDEIYIVRQRHTNLETQWMSSLEELRIQAAETEERVRFDMNVELKKEHKVQEQMKITLEENYGKITTLEHELSLEKRSKSELKERYDAETERLQSLADTNRAQADEAQSRVLDIHKQMLEDMRDRDNKTRSQQIQDAKEQTEFQSKYNEALRLNELKNNENRELKRRITELEETAVEYKKVKLQHQEMELSLARIESEKKQIETQTETLRAERDRLRKENLVIEGEVAVLRAEKKVNDTRKSMSQ